MVYGFWKQLKRPIFCLAPMANVTDAAFRSIIAKYGKPDVMWTEFVSCDGLCSKGRDDLLVDLRYSDAERPIVAQLFGSDPEHFYRSAVLLRELGFDGIDINMGCPDRSVEKQGAGARLITNPEHAVEIIKETQRGAGEIPVSVKTRIGYNKDDVKNWIVTLLAAGPAAIIIHARTRKEMSLVPARWDAIAEAVEVTRARDRSPDRTLIIGNGDVGNRAQGLERIQQTGVDGVMIGRAIFGNPWLFSSEIDSRALTVEKRVSVMIEHTYLFESMFKGVKPFDLMKKHYKAYTSGFDRAKELRAGLMEARDAQDVERRARSWLRGR